MKDLIVRVNEYDYERARAEDTTLPETRYSIGGADRRMIMGPFDMADAGDVMRRINASQGPGSTECQIWRPGRDDV